MQQLGKVQTKTTWANASNVINSNSDKIYEAITQVENKFVKNKGYFTTYDELYRTYRSAEDGSQAFVYNAGNDPSTPYDIYGYIDGEWLDTGLDGGSTSVDLSTKQDLLNGYVEHSNDDGVEEIHINSHYMSSGGGIFIDGTIGEMRISVYNGEISDNDSGIEFTPERLTITSDTIGLEGTVSMGNEIQDLEAYVKGTRSEQDAQKSTIEAHTQAITKLQGDITTNANNSAPSAPITDILTIL